MDCHEISYLSIFRKSIGKFKFHKESEKNNEYFTRRPSDIFYYISLSSS